MTRSGMPLHTYISRGAPGAPPVTGTVQEFDSEVLVTLDGSNKVQRWEPKPNICAVYQNDASKRPTYVVNPTGGFNGRKVVHFEQLSQQWLHGYLNSSGGQDPIIFPISSKPYVATVMQVRNISMAGSQVRLYSFTANPDSHNAPTLALNEAGMLLQVFNPAQDYQSANGSFRREDPVFFESWLDAAGKNTLAINRVVVGQGGTAAPGGLTRASTRIAFGAFIWNGENSECSIAYQRACSAVPPDAERDALYAWAVDRYALNTPLVSQPPLPANTRGWWHGEMGVTHSAGNVSRWDSRFGGGVTALYKPTNRFGGSPVWATDGAHFNGRKVVQTGPSNKTLGSSDNNCNIIGAFERPWSFSVVRLPAPSTTDHVIFALGVVNVTTLHAVTMGAGSDKLSIHAIDGNRVISTVPVGTGVRMIEAWCDGTNANLRVGGIVTSAPFSGSSGHTSQRIGIGVNQGGEWPTGPVHHGLHVFCASKPTDPEIAALRSWAASYYGAT